MHKNIVLSSLAGFLMVAAVPSMASAQQGQQICTGSGFVAGSGCTVTTTAGTGTFNWNLWNSLWPNGQQQQQQQDQGQSQFQDQVVVNDVRVNSSTNVGVQTQNNNQNLNQNAVNIVGGGSGSGNNAGSISQSGAQASNQEQQQNVGGNPHSQQKQAEQKKDETKKVEAKADSKAIAKVDDNTALQVKKDEPKKVAQVDKGELPKKLPATGSGLEVLFATLATAAGAGAAATRGKLAAAAALLN